jgi:hypothetical protein
LYKVRSAGAKLSSTSSALARGGFDGQSFGTDGSRQLFDHAFPAGDQLGALFDQLIRPKLVGCVAFPGTGVNFAAKLHRQARGDQRAGYCAPSTITTPSDIPR